MLAQLTLNLAFLYDFTAIEMGEPVHVILVAVGIGLVAGVVGGLAGIGGSIVMLPGLALLLGYETEARDEQHTYAAAAMIVNVLVSIPASLGHRKAKAIRRNVVLGMLPAMATSVIIGVLLSNRLGGRWLSYILAAFIAAYCLSELAKLAMKHQDHNESVETHNLKRLQLAMIGALAGLVGGLLGVGGGIIIVPLLQGLAKLPLRIAIAASATVMCFTATVGAIAKVSTLPGGISPTEPIVLAAAMGPTAIIGAWFGARLTHALPTTTVRLVVSVVLLASAVRMSGVVGVISAWF